MKVHVYKRVFSRPDHHLFRPREGANYECRFSVALAGGGMKRMLVSLRTKDLTVARKRRDGLLADVARADGLERLARKGGNDDLAQRIKTT